MYHVSDYGGSWRIALPADFIFAIRTNSACLAEWHTFCAAYVHFPAGMQMAIFLSVTPEASSPVLVS